MPTSLSSALERLANYRSNYTRASEEIVQNGVLALQKRAPRKLGDEAWPFLEQLALAAIDCGNLEVADDCINLLVEKFPSSPRVDCLQGIRIEASESPTAALQYYNKLLEDDESNAAAWKRKISVMRSFGPSNTQKTVEELVSYLDTFYTDVEGWLELADIYCDCNQYTNALHSVSHAMLLTPQNPFYVLQAGQTAFDANDVNLSIKFFLRAVEMTAADEPTLVPKKKQEGDKVCLRGWYGVKLCTNTLLRSSDPMKSDSQTPALTSEYLHLIDELATESLAAQYSGPTVSGRSELLEWLQKP